MADGTEPKKLNVVHVGPGALALGYILPAMDAESVNLTVLMRPYETVDDGKEESDRNKVKRLLFEKKRFRAKTTGESGDGREVAIDQVLFQDSVPDGFWNNVDVLTMAPGYDQIEELAVTIGGQFFRDYPSQDICILVFANGSRPSTKFRESMIDAYRNLSRSENYKACDVVVDSMCTLECETVSDEEIAVGRGQASPSAVILAPDQDSLSTVKRVFKSGNGFRIIEEDSSEQRDKLYGLLEKKKAWFVNAPDYIVAAHSADKNYTSMRCDDEVTKTVMRFGEIAKQELISRCVAAGISKDEIVGDNSFLGSCSTRLHETLRNIDSGHRDYYGSVLKDLGVHHGILEFFDNKEFDVGLNKDRNALSRVLFELAEVFEVNMKKCMVEGVNEACKCKDDRLKEYLDSIDLNTEVKNDILDAVCGGVDKEIEEAVGEKARLDNAVIKDMLVPISGFYGKTNMASYMQKLRERLIIVPYGKSPDPSSECYNPLELTEGDRQANTSASILLQLLDQQLGLLNTVVSSSASAVRTKALESKDGDTVPPVSPCS